MSATIEIAVGALVSGIITTLFVGYIKMYIDKKLTEVEKEKERYEQRQRRRNVANAKLRRAEGRLLFWLHRAIVTGTHNGELESAWESFDRAEEEAKVIDQEIVADYESSG